MGYYFPSEENVWKSIKSAQIHCIYYTVQVTPGFLISGVVVHAQSSPEA